MLKLALAATVGIAAVALSMNEPAPGVMIGACDVSNKAEAIQWGQKHPGQSYVEVCRTAGNI